MQKNMFEIQLGGLSVNYMIKDEPRTNHWNHVHSEYELLYILSGNIVHGIEDRVYMPKKGDLVIVRPNNYHYIEIQPGTPYERYDIFFSPQMFDNIDLIPPDLDVLNCRHNPIISEIFRKLDYYRRRLPDKQLEDVITLLLKELIYNISLADTEKNNILPENIHPLISRALAEINENLFTIKTIDEVADKLFVSKGYLFRMFKHEMKTTPLKYITEKRLHAAQSLLAQGKSPTHIYRECGFNDYTAFYRSYMKLFGHAPSK